MCFQCTTFFELESVLNIPGRHDLVSEELSRFTSHGELRWLMSTKSLARQESLNCRFNRLPAVHISLSDS